MTTQPTERAHRVTREQAEQAIALLDKFMDDGGIVKSGPSGRFYVPSPPPPQAPDELFVNDHDFDGQSQSGWRTESSARNAAYADGKYTAVKYIRADLHEQRLAEERAKRRSLMSADEVERMLWWCDVDGVAANRIRTWNSQYSAAHAAGAEGAEPFDDPVLDAPARVGFGIFVEGVRWATVIRAAQRLHKWWEEEGPIYGALPLNAANINLGSTNAVSAATGERKGEG